jgi:plastocyanin domain-containing protein
MNTKLNLASLSRSFFAFSTAFIFAILMITCSPPLAFAEDAKPIVITLQNHLYRPSEIHVPAHQRAILIVKNLDATPEEFESGALQIEKVIPANSEGTVRIRPSEHGHYTFVGEYHEKIARGVIIVE